MRIAYITETYPPEDNSVALSVERTVRFLRDRGHEVELIRPRQSGESSSDTANEWRSASLPFPRRPDLRCGLAFVETLNKRFARSRPELVHIATQGPLGHSALLAAEQRGLPVTTDFQTDFHSYTREYRLGILQPFIRNYLRKFHNRGRRTFVPSHSVQNDLVVEGFQRLEVVGRGVACSLGRHSGRSTGFALRRTADP